MSRARVWRGGLGWDRADDSRNVLEDAVNATREENERLRQRIAALSAARNGGAQVDTANAQETSPAVSPPQETPGIDFTYLGKLQAEISSAKTQLLDKQLELNRIKAGDAAPVPYAEIEVLRHVLLSHHGKLATLQAEATSLQAVIEHVQRERTELAGQRELLAKEVEARKGASGVTGLEAGVETAEEAVGVVDEGADARAGGADRTLMDITGWVDAAVKSWEQVGST